ncbi:MAG: nitroreductase family protein, partial [Dehalococcoidia bacterium]
MPDDIGLFEAIYTQRAIRRLKPDPVSDELVHKLIEAATKAPNGGATEPWAFLVVRDAAAKKQIGAWYLDAWNNTYGRMSDQDRERAGERFGKLFANAASLAGRIAEAPVWIIVCARGVQPGSNPGAGFYGSVYPAVQNLLLAARGLGLGATLTTLHKLHETEVKELLGIPADVETVALIPIGHPRGKYGPTTRR